MVIYMDMDTGKKVIEQREEYGEEVLLSCWLPQPDVGLALQEAVPHGLRSPARRDHAADERDAEAFLRNIYLCQE